mgnify:CR=1 FL=1
MEYYAQIQESSSAHSFLKNRGGKWIRSNEDKVELFAQYLETTFQPYKMQITVNLSANHRK